LWIDEQRALCQTEIERLELIWESTIEIDKKIEDSKKEFISLK
jgi:hypothetical protein